MTAAGEWLPERMRPGCTCPTVLVNERPDKACPRHPFDLTANRTLPAPLVAGAIGRSLTDARESYRAQLVAMWHEAGEDPAGGPAGG